MEDRKFGICRVNDPLIQLNSELYIKKLVYWNSDIENLHKTYTIYLLIDSPLLNLFSTLSLKLKQWDLIWVYVFFHLQVRVIIP